MDPVLHQTPLFASLDQEGASALRGLLIDQVVSKGEVLFYEGESGEDLFLILEGKIKLVHAATDGRESLVAVLGPGEMFGELSLFDPGPRTSTAKALTKTHALRLSNAQLMPWLASFKHSPAGFDVPMKRWRTSYLVTFPDASQKPSWNLVRSLEP